MLIFLDNTWDLFLDILELELCEMIRFEKIQTVNLKQDSEYKQC